MVVEHSYLHRKEDKGHPSHPAKWGYQDQDNWGDLKLENQNNEANGKAQSPVNIHDARSDLDLPDIGFDYHPSTIDLVYNGHTVKETGHGHSTILGGHFVLQQFHFHAPSEHTIDGEHAKMEMHLVHRWGEEGGPIAVVAVLIEEGDHDNPAFENVWHFLPDIANKGETITSSRTVDIGKLLPSDHRYYRYVGSFTTPPCTEGVLWMVLKTPIKLSAKQIAEFEAVICGNNRKPQRLHGRKISVSPQ